MPALEEELGLDVAPALAAIDSIDTALAQVVTNFSVGLASALDLLAAPVDVPLATDPTAVQSEIDALDAENPEITVGFAADTAAIAAAQDQLDNLEAAGDVDLSVNVDTAGIDAAQTGLEDLTNQADTAAQSTENIGTQAGKSTSGVAGLATAFLAGKGKILGWAGAIGVGVVGIHGLIDAGVDLVSSQQRINQVFGESADAIEEINVGDLNIGIDELGNKLGSTGADLKQAAANLGFFAVSAGASQEAAAKFAENVLALSARARALNPSLGSIEEIANRLPRALTRGGAAAARFGVSLSPDEIAAYAKSIGKIPEALTPAEKALVAAQVAANKFSTGLAADIESGTHNAQIQMSAFRATVQETFEKLGAPLIEPLLKLLEQIGPAVAAGGDALTRVLIPAFSILGDVLGAFATPLADFAAGMEHLPTPLLLVGAAILALTFYVAEFNTVMKLTSGVIDLVSNPIFLVAAALAVAVTAFGAFTQHSDAVKKSADGIREAVFGTVDSIEGLDTAIKNIDKTTADYIDSNKDFGEETGIINGIIKEQGVSLDDLVGKISSTDSAYRKTVKGIVDRVKLTKEEIQAEKDFAEQQGTTANLAGALADKQARVTDELEQERKAIIQSDKAMEEQLVVRGQLEAKQLREIINTARAKNGQRDYAEELKLVNEQVAINAARQEALDAANTADTLNRQADAVSNLAQKIAAGTAGLDDTLAVFAELDLPADQAKAFFDGVTQAINDFLDQGVSKLPQISNAFDDFKQGMDDAGKGLESAQKAFEDASSPDAQKQARENVKQATEAVADAKRGLDDATKNTASNTAKAAQAVEDAKKALAEATDPKDVERAQRTLQDAMDGLAKASDPRGVEDANRNVKSAVDGLAKASDDTPLKEAAAKLKAAQDALAKANDPQTFIDNLNKQSEAIRTWQANLQKLVAAGFGDVAIQLFKQGPEVAGTFTKGIADSLNTDTSIAEGARKAFGGAQTASTDYATWAETTFGPDLAKKYLKIGTDSSGQFTVGLDLTTPTEKQLTNVGVLLATNQSAQTAAFESGNQTRVKWELGYDPHTHIAQEADDTGKEIIRTAPTDQAKTAGTSTGSSFTEGYDPKSGVEEQNAATATVFDTGGPGGLADLSDAARTGGKTVGISFVDGIRIGIGDKDTTDRLDLALLALAIRMESKMRTALGSDSPSKVMRKVGVDAGQGLANGLLAAQGVVGAAGATLANAAVVSPSLTGPNGSSTSSAAGTVFNVNVNLASGDPAAAAQAGRLLAESAERALTRRGVIARVRTGG